MDIYLARRLKDIFIKSRKSALFSGSVAWSKLRGRWKGKQERASQRYRQRWCADTKRRQTKIRKRKRLATRTRQNNNNKTQGWIQMPVNGKTLPVLMHWTVTYYYLNKNNILECLCSVHVSRVYILWSHDYFCLLYSCLVNHWLFFIY